MNFCSDTLPPAERPRGYETALRRHFSAMNTDINVRTDPNEAASFAARLDLLRVGNLPGALHFSNSPHTLRAGRGPADHDGYDLYFVNQGQISFTDVEGTVELIAGDMGLRNANSAFESHSEQFEMLALGIPGEMLRATGARWTRDSHKLESRSVLSACLQGLLRATATRYAELTPGEGAVLQTSILDSVAHLAAGCKEPDLCPRHEDRLRDVKALALRTLSLTTLSPEHLAREVGISLRTLHRLFSLSGTTFGSWLREARLERCWRELTDPKRPRATIATIAFGWGFSDLRTFNRAFAARYGVTPTEARKTRVDRVL